MITTIHIHRIYETILWSILFKLSNSISNPYIPCGRFWESVPQRECKFSNAPTFSVNLRSNKAVLEPRVLPAFAITYFCNHCNIRFENTSKYVDTLTLFSKNLNQRSLTPRWPMTSCLLRSHVWLYPRIIVSKSHGNTSMYVDTVINFANYHIHTLPHTYTYYVQNEWSHSLYWTQFRRDNNKGVNRSAKSAYLVEIHTL